MSVIYCLIFIEALLDKFAGGDSFLELSDSFMIEWALFVIADIFLLRYLREVL